MIIRNETISDIEAISKVTIAAFQTLAISNHTEQFIKALSYFTKGFPQIANQCIQTDTAVPSR